MLVSNFLPDVATIHSVDDYDSSPIGAFVNHNSCMKLYSLSVTET